MESGLKEIQQTLDRYGSAVALGQGHIHSTYLLNGPDPLVAQALNTTVFPRPDLLMDNFFTIREAIRQSDLPIHIPRFRPFPNGRFLFLDSTGTTWRVMDYLADMEVLQRARTASDVREATQTMGQLATVLSQVSVGKVRPPIPRFFDPSYWWSRYRKARSGTTDERLHASRVWREWLEERHSYKASVAVPQRVIHGDGKINNFLFKPNGKIGAILDWDTAMPATVLDEFGYLARSLISQVEEDVVLPRSGYLNEAYLKVALRCFRSAAADLKECRDSDLLLYGLKRTVWVQAIRFLADYLDRDVYYPVQYPNHNLDRVRNQCGLLHELENYQPPVSRRR